MRRSIISSQPSPLIWITGVLCIVMFGGIAAGQTQRPLSAQLLAEDATSLARAARQRGDSVSGAILYSQKKLSCALCHAQGATDLLGSDLTQIDKDLGDAYVVESILQPSKVIKKGFESVRVLTVDGQIVIGRILKQDDQQLVLRDTSPTSRLVRLVKEDIEQVLPNEKSAMPDDIVDQLENRQQFLDLVKYLMDLTATGPSAAAAWHSTVREEVDDRIQGLALIDTFHCTSCHSRDTGGLFPDKQAPELASSAARIDPDYLERFIADPLHTKPGTSMPDVMGQRNESERREVAEAIAHYLNSQSDGVFERRPPDHAAGRRGRELFHTIGCVACHSPRADDGSEQLVDQSVPLGRLEEKYSIDSLAAFLENPHRVRPSGRMPNMALSHWEANDIANYLAAGSPVGGAADQHPVPRSSDPAVVVRGKQYFNDLGCIDCHQSDGDQRATRHRPLAELRTDRGCLSADPGDWPRFDLDDSQRELMRAAIEQQSVEFTDAQRIELTMATFRCFACHQRDHLGGVADERDPFFHTTNENLGPQGRLPPTLTKVGAKLKPDWLRQVLVSGRAIRPYIKTRMPQYGAANVGHLVDLYQRVDELPDVEFGRVTDRKEIKKIGTDLVGSQGLNCIACHTFQQKLSQTMPAVDLTEMAERLHKQWFYQYLRSPQLLSPHTVMPSFWPGGRSIRQEILDGDTNQQIEAIWQYLLDGRQARTPRGLHREPIELLASPDRAVMLRRSYQGIGKRGIGVGYPAGVNLAFDAEQMRIAMIWKGKFADPGGVWRGQGHGNVRPLGTDLIRFESGSELDDADSPWIVDDGRPPNHQFTGYFLDDIGRPTFTYRVGDLEVEDYSIDVKDEPVGETSLKRTLTFHSKRSQRDLAFRLATGDNVTQIDERTFLLGRSLRVRLEDRDSAKIVDVAEGKQLVIPLSLPQGKSTLTLSYSW
jgi:putative heme-binding domain-containing protein